MADNPLLTWEDGSPIKFFLQKNLEPDILENLAKLIGEHGGIITTKVPRQGFVLIDPESPEGERLIQCWETNAPNRSFVAWTFVEACIEAQKIIPQVFHKQAVGTRIHIHESINDEAFVESLKRAIWHSGGDPLASEDDSDVIVADEKWPGFQGLIQRFDHYRKKYVEDVGWVAECIESGQYKNTPHVKKNLGGRLPGTKRTEFTEVDDRNLIAYVAGRLPDPSMRGRTGNKLYQDLCNRTDLYPWATRHPWQSWRERFKNHADRFNRQIAEYLVQNPVPEDGKGLHGYYRATPAVQTPTRSQGSQSQNVNRSGGRSGSVGMSPQLQPYSQQNNGPSQSEAGMSSGNRLNRRDKEDHDNDNETGGEDAGGGDDDLHEDRGGRGGGGGDGWGSQWEIKEGNRPPPDWVKGKGKEFKGKRKEVDVDVDVVENGSPSKKRKINPNDEQSRTQDNSGAEEADIDEDLYAPTKTTHLHANETAAPSSKSDSNRTPNRASPSKSNNGRKSPSPAPSHSSSSSEEMGTETQTLFQSTKEFVSHPLPSSSQSKSAPPTQSLAEPLPVPAYPPVSDPHIQGALARIACQYEFLVTEVEKEYDERKGDVEGVRTFFREVRDYINMKKAEARSSIRR